MYVVEILIVLFLQEPDGLMGQWSIDALRMEFTNSYSCCRFMQGHGPQTRRDSSLRNPIVPMAIWLQSCKPFRVAFLAPAHPPLRDRTYVTRPVFLIFPLKGDLCAGSTFRGTWSASTIDGKATACNMYH